MMAVLQITTPAVLNVVITHLLQYSSKGLLLLQTPQFHLQILLIPSSNPYSNCIPSSNSPSNDTNTNHPEEFHITDEEKVLLK